MFQRRHMEAIAEEVMTWDMSMNKIDIVANLSNLFDYHNPNFSPARFRKACEQFEGELE